MEEKPLRTEIECAYCLQPFSAPPISEQELICPYCGFRQLVRKPRPQAEHPSDGPGAPVPSMFRNGGTPSMPPPASTLLPSGHGLEAVTPSPPELSHPPGQSYVANSLVPAGVKPPPRVATPPLPTKPLESQSLEPEGIVAEEKPAPTSSARPRRRGRRWSLGPLTEASSLVTIAAVSLAAALAGFAAGFWVGRYGRNVLASSTQGASWAAHGQRRILVEGRITFRPDPLSGQPDAGAVIILLPANNLPSKTLPVEGLRPFEPPRSDALGPRAVAELGGTTERADESGRFMLVLSPGEYYVLIISRKTRRPQGAPIRPSDLAAMRKYFYAAEDLIGTAKYHWSLYRFREGKYTVDHNFGLDEGNQVFDPLNEIRTD
ncbi:MAG: hypothetical protein RMJ16_07620 [Thermoguttaceae bacterium]|nr:hypothetical protein [Thermoguttaceae bacterium]